MKKADGQEVEVLAKGTGKLMNQGQTEVPSKEISERAGNRHRQPSSDYSSNGKKDKVFACSRVEPDGLVKRV